MNKDFENNKKKGDHFRSQYSLLLYKMQNMWYKMNKFICEVSNYDVGVISLWMELHKVMHF